MNSMELFESYFGTNYNPDHINDNIDWCINRGIPSLSFYHANPYFHYSNYIRNLGDSVTINTGRLI